MQGGFASLVLPFELDFFVSEGDGEAGRRGSVVLGVLVRMHSPSL